MASLQELTELKSKVERLARERDKAAGALEQSLRLLKEQFGYSSVEEAEKGLKRLSVQVKDASESFQAAMEAFQKKWEGKL